MRVLRLTLTGATASFRYPHFMLGKQPTYEMPPPATIYGHLCSALGDWFDPAGVQFAYHFTYASKFVDLEHVHVMAAASGKLKAKGQTLPKVQEGTVQPYARELLFQPRLTLYINQPHWESAFRSPRYAVALGRSQDLGMYTDVRVISLDPRSEAYLEHTLLPVDFPLQPAGGLVLLMPRWLNPHHGREPAFQRYLLLPKRVFTNDPDILCFGSAPTEYWVDPDSPELQGKQRGLVFLPFV